MRIRFGLLTVALGFVLVALPAFADTITLAPTKDSFLRRDIQNINEGANTRLSIRRGGNRFVVSAFDLTDVQTAITGGKTLVSAKLRLFVTANSKNWGKNGRLLNAHMLLADWTEGNGSNAKVSLKENENGNKKSDRVRGTGAGVTWRCATDTDIADNQQDCVTRWNGGSFNTTPTAQVLIRNSTAGYIEFDVTADVQNFLNATFPNFGWLIKKASQAFSGQLWFASRESTTNQPQLVVEVL